MATERTLIGSVPLEFWTSFSSFHCMYVQTVGAPTQVGDLFLAWHVAGPVAVVLEVGPLEQELRGDPLPVPPLGSEDDQRLAAFLPVVPGLDVPLRVRLWDGEVSDLDAALLVVVLGHDHAGHGDAFGRSDPTDRWVAGAARLEDVLH
jgi:hypothetical protein